MILLQILTNIGDSVPKHPYQVDVMIESRRSRKGLDRDRLQARCRLDVVSSLQAQWPVHDLRTSHSQPRTPVSGLCLFLPHHNTLYPTHIYLIPGQDTPRSDPLQAADRAHLPPHPPPSRVACPLPCDGQPPQPRCITTSLHLDPAYAPSTTRRRPS
jgi:hypothetical protein